MLSGKLERLSLLFSAMLHALALSAFVLAGVGGGAEEGVLMVDVVYSAGPAVREADAGLGEEGPGSATPVSPRPEGAQSGKAAENAPARNVAEAVPGSRELPEPPKLEDASFQEPHDNADVPGAMDSGETDDFFAPRGKEAPVKEPPGGGFRAEATTETGDASADFDAAGRKEARAAVLYSIRASIQKALSYPLLARKRGMEGTVVAAFAIGRDGTPGRIRLVRSSGHGMLDGEVMRTIAKASPYPPIEGEVEVPVTFRLKDE